jgi:hypothetical protein
MFHSNLQDAKIDIDPRLKEIARADPNARIDFATINSSGKVKD